MINIMKLKNYNFSHYDLYEEHQKIIDQLNDIVQPSNNQRKKMLARMKEIEQLPEYKKEYPIFKSFTDITKNLNSCNFEFQKIISHVFVYFNFFFFCLII